MNISDLLTPASVVCSDEVSSKKRALEMLSEMLAASRSELAAGDIFNSLLSRERLGSTGLGHGVAIPHGRVPGIDTAVAAMLKLSRGVDYDAPDHEPVDILFALLVPQESTDEHLQILAALARRFADPSTLARLRVSEDSEALFAEVSQWNTDADQ
ncbi:PTS sugar transporter subunit IIA [Thioalkalivibrio denitrificans]|uniref:PTS sugar transporter subunit IIA n=1 Tax=Thioalkalivibrio denitrificans TaxID=108003 RepID=A0A1V3NRZ5_9GAMM|nr:PTS sugar transporter subunit IIA [Thioalkalivibrio denitrificans]OOG27820.1 PTS sugar transporter subunit IIA [Thioalkalivibrio denitrificans]